jgi:hypothetical protein
MLSTWILIAAILLAAAGAARAKDDFLIGMWYGPNDLTQEKIAEVAEANFTVVTVHDKSVEDNKKLLDLAQANGIKVHIIDDRIQFRNPYKRGFQSNLDKIIADYSSHPALWGYCIGDEPNASQFIKWGGINRYLLSKDPDHIPYINLYPTYASKKQLGWADYEQYVDEYLRVVGPRILSYDHYPFMLDGTDRADYFLNLEIIRRQGIKHKTPFVTTPMSLPHIAYRDPTEAELRWQVNTSLAYGARGIFWFTYTTPPFEFRTDPHNALIAPDGTRDRKYWQIKQINGELLKLAPTIMRLNSVAVYHTGAVPEGAKPLPEDGLIGIEGGEFVVGQFNSDRGEKYAMFVNRNLPRAGAGFPNPGPVRITFSQKVTVCQVSPETGRLRAIPLIEQGGKWVWLSKFKPGEGKLVRIDVAGDRPVPGWEDPLHFRPRVMLNPSAQYWNLAGSEDPNHPDYYCEALNMYDIACRVRDYLVEDGRVDVFMSRSSRTEESTLKQETDLTRNLNCDVLVSLHSDATGTDDPGGGSWTFYADEFEGKRLGECVQMPLLEAIKTFHPDVLFRGVRTHWYRLWVLHEAGCPASLTEFLFHSNPVEREMLKNPEYQDIMAKAFARGILDFFGLS